MKTLDSEKAQLKANLKDAVMNCQVLKVGRRTFNKQTSPFNISHYNYLDFTEEKYQDGGHSYRLDAYIEITNKNGEIIGERCDIHFYARIDGANVEIENDLIIVEKNIIPMNWE